MQIQHRELHRVVVTAIAVKYGKYLIIQRSKEKKDWPGTRTAPGGGIEVDDYIDTQKKYKPLVFCRRKEIGTNSISSVVVLFL